VGTTVPAYRCAVAKPAIVIKRDLTQTTRGVRKLGHGRERSSCCGFVFVDEAAQ